MIPLTATSSSVTFKVRVTPRAGRTVVAGERDGALAIRLAAAPVDGAANSALISFLSDLLGVSRRQISIASGQKSRDKVVAVSGVSPDHVTARLVAILPA